MIDIECYMRQIVELLIKRFDSRLLYVGLQGSYLRGEATKSSDIDIMVVLDELSVSDLDAYRNIIFSMDHSDKSCGFICSKSDLANWNPMEICNLLHGTKDYYGVLRPLIPEYTREDIRNFIKISVNNLYHEICHRHVHTQNRGEVKLETTYKGVFFILQNIHYLHCGEFCLTKQALLQALEGTDRDVLQRCVDMHNGAAYGYMDSFLLLFSWCRDTIKKL